MLQWGDTCQTHDPEPLSPAAQGRHLSWGNLPGPLVWGQFKLASLHAFPPRLSLHLLFIQTTLVCRVRLMNKITNDVTRRFITVHCLFRIKMLHVSASLNTEQAPASLYWACTVWRELHWVLRIKEAQEINVFELIDDSQELIYKVFRSQSTH